MFAQLMLMLCTIILYCVQYLEKTGDTAGARKHYELSGTAHVEVPRMLYQAESFDELEQYITKQEDDHELLTWWARFCESRGDIKKALACYEKAGDALSMVRIFCYTKNLSAAEEQVQRLGDPAAAFHLARQYEAQGRISEAIRFYTQVRYLAAAIAMPA